MAVRDTSSSTSEQLARADDRQRLNGWRRPLTGAQLAAAVAPAVDPQLWSAAGGSRRSPTHGPPHVLLSAPPRPNGQCSEQRRRNGDSVGSHDSHLHRQLTGGLLEVRTARRSGEAGRVVRSAGSPEASQAAASLPLATASNPNSAANGHWPVPREQRQRDRRGRRQRGELSGGHLGSARVPPPRPPMSWHGTRIQQPAARQSPLERRQLPASRTRWARDKQSRCRSPSAAEGSHTVT